uniref:Uncharacterized protein n=1 Tax=Timema bartmani TaxID=61472 RepID=A0A7R9F2K2_9NEOP|nr:unnamed protein product [Timema bartmani]
MKEKFPFKNDKASDDDLKKPLSSRSTKRMFADEAAKYDKLHFDDILQAHKTIRPDVHVSPLVSDPRPQTRYTPDTQPYGTFAALLEPGFRVTPDRQAAIFSESTAYAGTAIYVGGHTSATITRPEPIPIVVTTP